MSDNVLKTPPTSMWLIARRLILIIAAVVVVSAGAVGVWMLRVKAAMSTEVECANRLRLVHHWATDVASWQGEHWRPPPLGEELGDARLCPFTNTPFIYSPPVDAGYDRAQVGGRGYIVAWTPRPSPRGEWHVLYEAGWVQRLSDNEFWSKMTSRFAAPDRPADVSID